MGCLECKKAKRGSNSSTDILERRRLVEPNTPSKESYSDLKPKLFKKTVSSEWTRLADSRRSSIRRAPPIFFSASASSNFRATASSLKWQGSSTERESVVSDDDIQTKEGQELLTHIFRAYRWRDRFSEPSQEFLALMDRLYMECQLHLTTLASRGDVECRRETDAIVSEIVSLRNYWGPQLLPNSTCNAFVRERISLTLGVEQRQFRIDCLHYFEPVPANNAERGNPNEPHKIYQFIVFRNECKFTSYCLHRLIAAELNHVLVEEKSGHVHSYGADCPLYWEVREHLLEAVQSTLYIRGK